MVHALKKGCQPGSRAPRVRKPGECITHRRILMACSCEFIREMTITTIVTVSEYRRIMAVESPMMAVALGGWRKGSRKYWEGLSSPCSNTRYNQHVGSNPAPSSTYLLTIKNTPMKSFSITIQGITPYMQHRMDEQKLEEWEKNRKLIIEREDVAKDDIIRAEYHCYRNKENKCFIPSEHLRQCFIAGGGMVKSKTGTSRKSMKDVVAAMFFVAPDQILIPDYDEIDKRSATNQKIKARIIVIRPKWTNWSATFDLDVDNDTITDETIKSIIENSGNYCGIGSYRPTCKGQFGRFKLAKIIQK